MRIYNAICAYIEAKAKALNEPEEEEDTPQPDGDNFATVERADMTDRNHELNTHDRPSHYGRSISLKWHE